MAAGNGLTVAAALPILVLICFLAVASGLEIPHYTEYMRMYGGSSSAPARRFGFGYTPGRVLVIDLGNTNSCVAGYGGPGETDNMFQFCVPSWVAFTDEGAVLVGDAAKNHAAVDPANAIFGFKRVLGLTRTHKNQDSFVRRATARAPYKVGEINGVFPSVEVKSAGGAVKHLDFADVASAVVAELKTLAERHLGHPVWRAVITVPLHFGEASRCAAVDACKLAGLEVDDGDTVVEPVAAAVAYGLHRKLREGGSALVLRVGGGTADASVVTLWDGSLKVMGYGHDLFLGGDDFDQRILDHFVDLIKTKHGKDVAEDPVALRKLRAACERAKKALSGQDRVHVGVESLFDGVDFSEPLLRSEFEELNDDLFGKVMALVEGAIADAKLWKKKKAIDEVVLVGGSTVIPKLQKLVKEYFDGKEVNVRVKPDEAINVGAAFIVTSDSIY